MIDPEKKHNIKLYCDLQYIRKKKKKKNEDKTDDIIQCTGNTKFNHGDTYIHMNGTQISQCHTIVARGTVFAKSLLYSLPLPHSALVSIRELSVVYVCHVWEKLLTF